MTSATIPLCTLVSLYNNHLRNWQQTR